MQPVTNKTFHMDNEFFDKWTDLLIDEAYDWKQIGISNDYCNEISEPKFGLRLLDWADQEFEVVNGKKYAVFLLRYR
jgi:hypothetical protein